MVAWPPIEYFLFALSFTQFFSDTSGQVVNGVAASSLPHIVFILGDDIGFFDGPDALSSDLAVAWPKTHQILGRSIHVTQVCCDSVW